MLLSTPRKGVSAQRRAAPQRGTIIRPPQRALPCKTAAVTDITIRCVDESLSYPRCPQVDNDRSSLTVSCRLDDRSASRSISVCAHCLRVFPQFESRPCAHPSCTCLSGVVSDRQKAPKNLYVIPSISEIARTPGTDVDAVTFLSLLVSPGRPSESPTRSRLRRRKETSAHASEGRLFCDPGAWRVCSSFHIQSGASVPALRLLRIFHSTTVPQTRLRLNRRDMSTSIAAESGNSASDVSAIPIAPSAGGRVSGKAWKLQKKAAV